MQRRILLAMVPSVNPCSTETDSASIQIINPPHSHTGVQALTHYSSKNRPPPLRAATAVHCPTTGLTQQGQALHELKTSGTMNQNKPFLILS